MNMPLVLLNRRRRGFTAFSPSTLFALAEPGVWFDPSDLTTLFTDPAGTTPVTAPGNTVGLMLDKSKGLALGAELVANGDFAEGSTDWTTEAVWTIGSGVATYTSGGAGNSLRQFFSMAAGKSYRVTFNVVSQTGSAAVQATANGVETSGSITTTGAKTCILTPTATRSQILFYASGTGVLSIDNISVRELPGNHATQATLTARPTYSIEPVGGRRNLLLATDTLATQSLTVAAVAHTLAFTGTGTVTLTGASIAGPLIGTGASNRVSLTFTPTAASLTLTVVGSVTLGQLELGSSVTAYQRVTTQYDVTEAGVASTSYLAFDGVDDGMVTGTITPGVDKAQVFAGVRKLSDAAAGTIAELSASASANNGAFILRGPFTTSANYGYFSRGTAGVTATTPASYPAPITNVLTGLGDISGDLATLRINGTQAAQSTADQGTGNFLAYPLYIGRRGGSSLPFTGHLYSLITRFGANLDAGVITNTETWVAQKTGIVI